MQASIPYRAHYLKAFSVVCLSLLSLDRACAVPYGNPDARALAMGGTGVASPENAFSAYFNPALLAAYDERKHRGGNQRIVFPMIFAGANDNVELLYDIEDLDYEDSLNTAINNFNGGGSADEVLAVLEPLDTDLTNVSATPFSLDSVAGLVVTIPDRREGGAFSVSRRAVLDGQVDYSPTDTALVSDYLEELENVRNGGAPGALHPELYQAGQLIDPSANFVSTASAVGLVMDELSFSMAWQVEAWDQRLMLGFTPKLVKVTTYEYFAVATSDQVTERGELDNKENINFDLGYAQFIGDNLLVGVAIKNVIAQEYETESGAFVELKPQIRVGSQYTSSWGTYTLDLDLVENEPLATGDPSQEIAFGGEWGLGRQRLRAGIHMNLAGTGANGDVGYSLGLRFRLLGMFADFTASDGANQRAAALQLGVRF